MKIFTIWAKYEQLMRVPIEFQNWQPVKFGNEVYTFIGGSNQSYEDALSKAVAKADIVSARIEGKRIPSKPHYYEVEIREEIIATIDEKNIITRNRYGALVLNSQNVMSIDIDSDYFLQATARRGLRKLFKFIFGISESDPDILSQIEKIIKRLDSPLTFRIYQTFAGYRLLVMGHKFEANHFQTKEYFKIFHSDPLYAHLCFKQNCFRSRLSAKPWRIGLKRKKIIFPFRTETENEEHTIWVRGYHQRADQYSVCRFVKQIGPDCSDKVIDYHDKFCKVHSSLPLA
ncbi:MAG: hypothetical protein H6607_00975 [Flavobacteriales bacterium]|nr:hypothetical protein [Flavobacteriales bacterium]